jgi:hypothetical protein
MPFPILLALAAGTVAAGLGSSFLSGKASAKANAASAAAAKQEAAMARLAGIQSAELHREQLRQTLGAIDAITAQRGVDPNSPTGEAIRRKTQEDAYRDEAVEALGYLSKASASELQAKGYRRASKYALPLAMLGGIADAGRTALSYGVGG